MAHSSWSLEALLVFRHARTHGRTYASVRLPQQASIPRLANFQTCMPDVGLSSPCLMPRHMYEHISGILVMAYSLWHIGYCLMPKHMYEHLSGILVMAY